MQQERCDESRELNIKTIFQTKSAGWKLLIFLKAQRFVN